MKLREYLKNTLETASSTKFVSKISRTISNRPLLPSSRKRATVHSSPAAPTGLTRFPSSPLTAHLAPLAGYVLRDPTQLPPSFPRIRIPRRAAAPKPQRLRPSGANPSSSVVSLAVATGAFFARRHRGDEGAAHACDRGVRWEAGGSAGARSAATSSRAARTSGSTTLSVLPPAKEARGGRAIPRGSPSPPRTRPSRSTTRYCRLLQITPLLPVAIYCPKLSIGALLAFDASQMVVGYLGVALHVGCTYDDLLMWWRLLCSFKLCVC